MKSIRNLKQAVTDALAYLKTQSDIREAEVFAAANGNLTVRLNYTSHIPSNGVEEPKSIDSYGVGIRIAMDSPQGVLTSFGSEPSDLSLEGVKRALEKALRGAVHDPYFVSLPRPMGERSVTRPYHDAQIMRLTDAQMVEAGWQTLGSAFDVFQSSEELLAVAGAPAKVVQLGLILGGDVTFLQERIAIGSYHLPKVETDESTLAMSSVTAMVEAKDAKGTGWAVSGRLNEVHGQDGAEAARQALASLSGQRARGGAYRVVLGPQAVSEILEWILMPGLTVDTFFASASPFMGKLGKQIASEKLSLYDHGAMPGLAATKAITDEGLPTGKTELIRDGALVGLLSNHYEYERILRDSKGREKLGIDPAGVKQAILPRNGFRTGRGGGRNFDVTPGTTATNLVVEGKESHTRDELLQMVGDGIYVGRIWYTYPINGISAGDFSGTIVGDSYLIKDGRLAAPLKPNTLRINENLHNMLGHIMGIGSQRRGTIRWASDQVTWAPEMAVSDFHLAEIGEYMDQVWSEGPR